MSRRLISGFRGRYGASPLHLLLVLASFALTAYAGIRLLEGDALGVALWFVGAALVHDLVLLPLYTVTDRGLQTLLRRRRRSRGARAGQGAGATTARGWINYVRVPAFISLLLLLVWYPLILEQVDRFTANTALDAGVFWENWLLITAALFAASALCLVASALRGRRRDAGADGS